MCIICLDTWAALQEERQFKKEGQCSAPGTQGCQPQAEVSQGQSLEKPTHNPEKCRQPLLLIRTLLAERMLMAQVSKRRHRRKRPQKTGHTDEWQPTHVEEVLPRAAFCAAARRRRGLRREVLGVHVRGGFSGGRVRFPLRHAVDIQGPCNKETSRLFLTTERVVIGESACKPPPALLPLDEGDPTGC